MMPVSEVSVLMPLIKLSLEYFSLVFVTGVGVLQVVAVHNNLRGLLFFTRRLDTYVFAASTIAPCMLLFFTWNYRNATGVIEGSQQAGLFSLALAASVLFTIILSSLLNRARLSQIVEDCEGLDALRQETFFRLIQRRFGKSK